MGVCVTGTRPRETCEPLIDEGKQSNCPSVEWIMTGISLIKYFQGDFRELDNCPWIRGSEILVLIAHFENAAETNEQCDGAQQDDLELI